MSLPDIAQNVLLYVPVGLFGVWALRGRRLAPVTLACLLMALAFVYSAAMELLQMLFADRIASPLDIVANVGGTAAGIALAVPTEHLWAIAASHLRRTGLMGTPARYVLAAILAAVLVAAWYPFDITLDLSTLSERTRAVRRDPWLRPSSSALWAQGARYFFVAATIVFCLPKLSRWAAPVALAVTVLIAVVVDVGQLGMGLQPIGLAAFGAQAVGALAGAVAALVVTLVRGSEYAAA